MTSASDSGCSLIFHGVRGTVPTCDPANQAYGGNTTCLEIGLAPDRSLLLDCGTGLQAVERRLTGSGDRGPYHFEVLLTHYHMDHLIGLPAFKPLYEPGNSFAFYGVGYDGGSLKETLERFLCPPWFPLSLQETAAEKSYIDLSGESFDIGPLQIGHAGLNHPQGVTAYRLQGPERSLLFATDCERGDVVSDGRFIDLASGADILVHDAQYTTEEYEQHCRGWGHSTWMQAVEAAQEAEAGRLVLFHHDPGRSDHELQDIVQQAGAIFPAVEAAVESMRLEL